MWLFAPHLQSRHGFSTRHGGVSSAPFDALNLDDREDDASRVRENRARALGALGLRAERVARLTQVHGTDVLRARAGVQEGDALVSNEPGLALVIGTADCYPVLLEDTEAGVVGAAHAGWRGTVGRIAARTVEAMVGLGARADRVRAAVGPGICGERYPVGAEVARAFEEAGLGAAVTVREGRTHVDLLTANRMVLREAGVDGERVWVSGRCSTEADFFSFRRDSGRTGRMWSVIALHEAASLIEVQTASFALNEGR